MSSYSSFKIVPLVGSSTVCLLLLAIAGCSSNKAVPVPKLLPAEAARKAIEAYDSDADGMLSKAELSACPGILVAMALYDQDEDGKVSQGEIESRLQSMSDAQVALATLTCKVSINGKPARGVRVKLVPEAYLGEQVSPALGTTSQRGSTNLSVPKDSLPEHAQRFRGVNYGTYKVEITDPAGKIPAKYNTATILGHEVAPDFGSPYATFELKSK